jgi:hypothetical protein
MQAAFKSDADMMAGAAAACETGIAASQSAAMIGPGFRNCIEILLQFSLARAAHPRLAA